MNVRTFVLVKDKKTFCSSATGEMDIPLNELIPALDINKNVDMAILPGARRWCRTNPQSSSGIATLC